ncbi:hypothetical protein FMEXI_7805 [Fusarium mexicanum]|uniref:Secreted protein n=1 Tax=Fusarium mexicanum TaxID=751941 RepID=A0A8H5IRV1_9HYPO|nr:hypothetical protein FMEXI_7805 [Fusarium mexicanum]
MKVAAMKRAIALGFLGTTRAFLIGTEGLVGGHVTKACDKALTSKIECNSYVPNMNPNYYQKWVGDIESADRICTKTCYDIFQIWNDTVAKDCAEGMNGSDLDARSTTHSLMLTIISHLWQGFNETCIKDTEAGRYCQCHLKNSAIPAMDPTIKEDYSGVKPGYWYCVEVNDGYPRKEDPRKVTGTQDVESQPTDELQPTEDKEHLPTEGSLEDNKQAILGKHIYA